MFSIIIFNILFATVATTVWVFGDTSTLPCIVQEVPFTEFENSFNLLDKSTIVEVVADKHSGDNLVESVPNSLDLSLTEIEINIIEEAKKLSIAESGIYDKIYSSAHVSRNEVVGNGLSSDAILKDFKIKHNEWEDQLQVILEHDKSITEAEKNADILECENARHAFITVREAAAASYSVELNSDLEFSSLLQDRTDARNAIEVEIKKFDSECSTRIFEDTVFKEFEHLKKPGNIN